MNRLSSKHIGLTPIRISSLLNLLLLCLCLIPITGCIVTRATPDTGSLNIHDDSPRPLPSLSLVRRVVPEVGTMTRRIMWATDDAVREVSESRFGSPEKEADLSCVFTGLKETLPGIDIIPTTTFWEQVAAPRDVIQLSELFVAPLSDRLRAIEADVMVIAYHTKIDLETTMFEAFISGAYQNKDKETAAIIVIDLKRKMIIHGSEISFEDQFEFGHHVFIIWGFITLDPQDICNTVGRQAGDAIAEAMPGRAVRALVVAAGKNPYWAARRGTTWRK